LELRDELGVLELVESGVDVPAVRLRVVEEP